MRGDGMAGRRFRGLCAVGGRGWEQEEDCCDGEGMGEAMSGRERTENTRSTGEDSPMLAAARAYTRRGWRVVPVRLGEKGVTLSGWQHMRLDEDDLLNWFGWFPRHGRVAGQTRQELHNVGILTGAPSGGLVDVDCDAPEAARAAKALLPDTGLISGRLSNPASHYWYQVAGELAATTK